MSNNNSSERIRMPLPLPPLLPLFLGLAVAVVLGSNTVAGYVAAGPFKHSGAGPSYGKHVAGGIHGKGADVDIHGKHDGAGIYGKASGASIYDKASKAGIYGKASGGYGQYDYAKAYLPLAYATPFEYGNKMRFKLSGPSGKSSASYDDNKGNGYTSGMEDMLKESQLNAKLLSGLYITEEDEKENSKSYGTQKSSKSSNGMKQKPQYGWQYGWWVKNRYGLAAKRQGSYAKPFFYNGDYHRISHVPRKALGKGPYFSKMHPSKANKWINAKQRYAWKKAMEHKFHQGKIYGHSLPRYGAPLWKRSAAHGKMVETEKRMKHIRAKGPKHSMLMSVASTVSEELPAELIDDLPAPLVAHEKL